MTLSLNPTKAFLSHNLYSQRLNLRRPRKKLSSQISPPQREFSLSAKASH